MQRQQAIFSGGDKPKSDPGRSITLFLALYLLVLAFFILLVSISTIEDVKSKALMESLSSTFSAVLPPRTDLTAFNATTGEFLAADEFQRQVTGLFSTVVGVIKVETIQPGRLMRVEIEGDSLFEVDQAVVRDGQSDFMDRLVSALSSNPPGLRFEMEVVAPTPWQDGETLPIRPNLAIERIGAFARELLKRGAPPEGVAIGLRGSEASTFEIWFHIRAEDENRIRFEDSPLIKIPEPEAPEETSPPPAPVRLTPSTSGGRTGISLPLPLEIPTEQSPPSTGPRSLVPEQSSPDDPSPFALPAQGNAGPSQ